MAWALRHQCGGMSVAGAPTCAPGAAPQGGWNIGHKVSSGPAKNGDRVVGSSPGRSTLVAAWTSRASLVPRRRLVPGRRKVGQPTRTGLRLVLGRPTGTGPTQRAGLDQPHLTPGPSSPGLAGSWARLTAGLGWHTKQRTHTLGWHRGLSGLRLGSARAGRARLGWARLGSHRRSPHGGHS